MRDENSPPFAPLPFTRNYWKQIHCKTNFRQTTFILYNLLFIVDGNAENRGMK